MEIAKEENLSNIPVQKEQPVEQITPIQEMQKHVNRVEQEIIQPAQPVEQVPQVAKQPMAPTAISILHGFRKEAEDKARFSMKIFILFTLLLIFDVAAFYISWVNFGDVIITHMAKAGMYFLIALSGYALINMRASKNRVKTIDDFYLEYESKNQNSSIIQHENKKL